MKSTFSIPRFALLFASATSICIVLGCGDTGPPKGDVAGTVTFRGRPLTSGTVTLFNDETGVGVSSDLDASGTCTFEDVLAGIYGVTIQPPPPPSPEEMAQGAKVKAKSSPIPKKFANPQTSRLQVTVKEGDENEFSFELKD